MYCLNDKQIDYILDDIRARGVEMEDLQYNLLDHVCCIIEQNLAETGDFEDFYQRTIKGFYKQELWELEEETISLIIFKNYYTMKKIMLYSGISSAILVTIGILFKFMHWPGAGMALVLGISISSLIFLPLLFILKSKEKQSRRDKIISGLGAVAGIALSMGILFKVMHWPGANMLGMGSVLLMVFVFLPIYFFTGIRNPETKVNTIVSSALIIVGAGLFMALIRSPKGSYIMKLRDTNTFVLNQELLKRERELSFKVAKDSLSQNSFSIGLKVDSLCEELKADLLELECGVRKLDRDFEQKELFITEGSYGYNPFEEIPRASKNYAAFKENINNYNATISDNKNAIAIPTKSNFIEYLAGPSPKILSKLGLITELNQIQQIVLQNNH